VIEKMIALIKGAKQSLLLSVWPDEILPIREHLVHAEKQGVEVIAAVFGESDLDSIQAINLERCGVTSQKRLGKHLTVVVADNKEVVISEIGSREDTLGVSTTTPSIVLVAKEYIKHDIWGHYLMEALGEAQFKQMCESNRILSSIINNP
jgi:sugar-specific transcriptional regulator TrmB